MADWKSTFVVCAITCFVVSAIKNERDVVLSDSADLHGGRILKSLVKRWGEDMFGGCHCSWHVGCISDSYCHHIHDHNYSCRPTCCGVECVHHGHVSSKDEYRS